MKSARMSRVAALLRRVADAIDPPAPAAASDWANDGADDDEFGPPERGPISVTRERQEERLVELQYLLDKFALHDSGSGLAWFESRQLRILTRLLQHELKLREWQLDKLTRSDAPS